VHTNQPERSRARHDLLWIVALTAAFAVISSWLELSEAVLTWTRPRERYQLDELPGVLVFLASALAWYAWRRVGEARLEIELRQRSETQLREALAQNRELAHAGVRMQEEERRSLARELHDELGQCLNAIKLDAVCLKDGGARERAQVDSSAAAIIDVTDHLEGVVRNMLRRLRPPGLDELGLPAALENCVDGWRRRLPAVEFTISVEGDIGPLDEATNITLYRLVQEGLTNVAKHARASRVDIVLQRGDATPVGAAAVVLTVQDNGDALCRRAAEDGLGIVGMRERVEALAGRFDLDEAGGSGFGFAAWLPIEQARLA
jgi:glucose-6-phosphate-specific signal transduction histidine kinase